MSNVRFGQNVATNTIDEDLFKGWGVRPSDWSFNVSVQQQILPRASIEVGYARRSFSGFNATDNRLVEASDYTAYSITAPSDSRLPGDGGQVVSGLLMANYAVPNAEVVPSLGRNLSGNATQVIVNLIEPGRLYGNRLNQLDLKVAKRLQFGARRALIGVDLFNALNSGAILSYNNTFNAIWLQPVTILTSRMAKKITAEFTF
jgi:hypothetical protein